MKFKDFKRKLFAILILSIAFCIGMNAQRNCQSPACYLWQNTDNLNLGAKLDTILRTLAASGGGGGSTLRQSTLDSIKAASYYSGIGSSQANLISEQSTVLNSVLTVSQQSLDTLRSINEALHYGGDIAFINTEGNNNTNACAISLSVIQACTGGYGNSFLGRHGGQNINKSVFWDAKDSGVFTDNNLISAFKTRYGNGELDSIRNLLFYGGKSLSKIAATIVNNTSASGHGLADYFRSDTNTSAFSILPFINNYSQTTSVNTGEIDDALHDVSAKSVFTTHNNLSYLENTSPIDTLLTETSYAALVTDLNNFYSNPYHLYSRILQESHSNAIVGATLTFYCVVRYKP